MPIKILNTIGPVYTEDAKKILDSLGVVHYLTLTQEELLACIADYDAAVIGLGLRFDEAVLERARKLKCIATATTGLDHIAMERADRRGITVLSLRGEEEFLRTITGTAELALGLMIDLVRGISHGFDAVRAGEWQRENFRGHMLSGKVLGIVGLGRLGSLMARYGVALCMQVIAYDPHKPAEAFQSVGARSVDWHTLLEESDAVSIHALLSPETENMFNAEAFAQMKPSAVLINTARSQIVDEPSLVAVLSSGRLAGYATDVLSGENDFGGRIPADHPLLLYAKAHKNCLIVPHIGGMTVESREATDRFIANKVAAWAQRPQ